MFNANHWENVSIVVQFLEWLMKFLEHYNTFKNLYLFNSNKNILIIDFYI